MDFIFHGGGDHWGDEQLLERNVIAIGYCAEDTASVLCAHAPQKNCPGVRRRIAEGEARDCVGVWCDTRGRRAHDGLADDVPRNPLKNPLSAQTAAEVIQILGCLYFSGNALLT